MILMTITPAGYLSLAVVIFCLGLTYAMGQRMQRSSGKPMGYFSFAYIFLIVLSLASLGTMAASSMASALSIYLTGERYTAEIVDFDWYWSEDSERRDIKMYTPIVAFKSETQGEQKRTLDISSGEVPVLGTEVTIYVNPDKQSVGQLSLGAVTLKVVGLLCGLLMLSGIFAAIQYAMNVRVATIINWVSMLFIKGVIPLAMSLFFGLLLYVVYAYFITGEKDDLPLWVISLVMLFALVLGLGLLGYLKSVFSKGH